MRALAVGARAAARRAAAAAAPHRPGAPALRRAALTGGLAPVAPAAQLRRCGGAAPEPLHYDDDHIKGILKQVRVIAAVGASDKWQRPSYFASKYLQQKGYTVIPVNPVLVEKGVTEVLGEKVYPDLASLPMVPDMVQVFRAGEAAGEVCDEAVKKGAKVVWMQLGVRHAAAAKRAAEQGVTVVQDRCPKIEFSRLFGELGWHGFDSQVISAKRRPIGKADGGSAAGGPRPEFRGFDTKAIHAGAAPDPTTGARATPIFQTTSYVFDDVDHAASLFNLQTFGHIYSRLSNPTVAVLEERITALEGGRGGTCTSSGHAAQLLTLFTLMQTGDRLVASNKLYGGSITQFGKTIQKFGWECTFVDVDDLDAVRAACAQPDVKLLWSESLANPGGAVSDMEALAEIAHSVKVPLVIDNTLATPYLCQPIRHGADIVVHSTTKYLSGHGNAVGGCVVDSGRFDWFAPGKKKYPSLAQPEPAYHGITFYESFGDLAFTIFGHAVVLRDLGSCMAPMNAYLTICGSETLGLRMQRHAENTLRIAKWLKQHPKVAWVSYVGTPDSKYYPLAQKYMRDGLSGAVFTFGVKGGFEAGVRFVERCHLFSHLANMGDVRSLVLHPASTTHRQLTDEQREAACAGDDVIRLSIGIESAEDLIADLEYALSDD
eukprot:TRINITY_DN19947_c0_g1_i1.p1 TRINITY_DN19947_c0_g1~~TRINITY_DN19947_c0_g1_i1.p1  ORF type:complete len:682 (+),score=214.11 TRINITY_DN19947_c0_g1_i1:72-2048(+)